MRNEKTKEGNQMKNKTKVFKVNYYPMSTEGDISVSKKTYKSMKKNCRKGGSHYLSDKLGRGTEVKKVNGKYIELETGREVLYKNLNTKEFNEMTYNENSINGYMMKKCRNKGMTYGESMKVVDNFLTKIQQGDK